MGASEALILLACLAILVGCGILTMRIAARGGYSSGGQSVAWFLLGFFFPLLGLAVAFVLRRRTG